MPAAAHGNDSQQSANLTGASVPGMTIGEERRLKRECESVRAPYNRVLSNGMSAREFAFLFVRGQRLKRRQKYREERSCPSREQQPTCPTTQILQQAT